MTTAAQTLLLLRHATAEPGGPGRRDVDRPLSAQGRTEAGGVGTFLRTAGLAVDHVLCSPSLRTRETLAGLAIDGEGAGGAAPVVDLVRELYAATAAELLELVSALSAATVLVVGHAPGIPEAVVRLAGPASSPAACAAVAFRYPPATLARLDASPGVLGPEAATLVGVRVPEGRDGRYFG